MNFARKVIIALNVEDIMFESLKAIRNMEFLRESELHFVHVYNTISYTYGFVEGAMIYPIDIDQKRIGALITEKMEKISKEIIPLGFNGKVNFQCLFDENPKRKFCEYVEDKNFDLIIIATREKHGIFDSSFAQYVSKHAKTNVLIIKPFY